jgi:hypothetical protein
LVRLGIDESRSSTTLYIEAAKPMRCGLNTSGWRCRLQSCPPALAQFVNQPRITAGPARKLAAASDVAIIRQNGRALSEGGDRPDMRLPGQQDELIRKSSKQPRTIVVLNAGSPVEMPWADQSIHHQAFYRARRWQRARQGPAGW